MHARTLLAVKARLALFVVLAGSARCAVALDLAALWDFARPETSEQRFVAALAAAQGDEALVLRTQIARTHGLRRDFERAKTLLRELQPLLGTAGPEVRVRHQLEWGRAHVSATHSAAQMTPEAREEARQAFQSALDLAREARLDELAIDAIHMFAFVDRAPAQQLHWAQRALAVVESSDQLGAKQWEASIRNNLGLALHRLGRFDEALTQFQMALALRERSGHTRAVRIAKWMVAWTLRALGRADESLAMQLALEREHAQSGTHDPFVYEELEVLYRARGDADRAQHYAQERQRVSFLSRK